MTSLLVDLIALVVGPERAGWLLDGLDLHDSLLVAGADVAPRAVVAQALAVILLDDLLIRVPSGAAYVAQTLAGGGTIHLDHGAVRTVTGVDCGELAPGQQSLAPVLTALGYGHRFTYDLARLQMTGRSWCHLDLPAGICQYFVSELHADRFSKPFQAAATRVFGTSRDPLTDSARADLADLVRDGSLPVVRAGPLLSVLVECFTCRHAPPSVADYDALRAESEEASWIAAWGTVFNHATDRVGDIAAVCESEREAGRPIKETVEVSNTGRVLQSAHRAPIVERTLRTLSGGTVSRMVPGSFFELIERRSLPDGSGIDLAFDAANAQQIFAMTRAVSDGRAPAG